MDTATSRRKSRDMSQEHSLSVLEVYRLQAVECLDSKQFSDARFAINGMAELIRHLDDLYKEHRGAPREKLETQIMYYSIWQRAIAAALILEGGTPYERTFRNLLEAQLKQARLLAEKEDRPEFKQLINKVERYCREVSSDAG